MASIVIVHECGHFAAARLQNIHVTKFSVGFGPRLFGFVKDGVDFKFCLFPLGGYVAFPDDDPEYENVYDKDDPDLLTNRPVQDRLLVTVAGIIANLIFAYAILLSEVATLGVSDPIQVRGGQRINDLLIPLPPSQMSHIRTPRRLTPTPEPTLPTLSTPTPGLTPSHRFTVARFHGVQPSLAHPELTSPGNPHNFP